MTEISSDPVSHYFDRLAPDWASRYVRDPRFQRRKQKILDLLQRNIDSPVGKRALDVGCGAGVFSMALAEMGFVVLGIDRAGAMVENAKDEARAKGNSASFEVSTLFDIQGRFDLVLSLSVLEYVEDDSSFVASLCDRTNQYGLLAVSVPNAEGLLRKIEKGIKRITKRSQHKRGVYLNIQKHQYRSEEFDETMHRLGLEKVEGIYLNAGVNLPPWLRNIFERKWWAAMYCGLYRKK